MTRRNLFTLLLFASFALVGVLGAVLAGSGGLGGWGVGRIAVIEVDGVIMDDEALLSQIRRFREDPTVRGFVVAINSPGGVVAPSQSVFRALRELREDEDGRPVVASIGAIGASGGYYVALAADSIYALPGSLTGSIGVIMEFPNAQELLRKVGLEMQIIKSSEHKDIGSPFRDMSERERALLEAMVADVYDQFVEDVAAERDMARERVIELADGRLFSGRQALAEGLVDAEGNIQDAIAAAGRMADLGSEPSTVRPPEPGIGLFEVLFGAVPASLRDWVAAADGTGPALKYMPTL